METIASVTAAWALSISGAKWLQAVLRATLRAKGTSKFLIKDKRVAWLGRASCGRAAAGPGRPCWGATASAVFASLVNMFMRGCWVNGIRRLIVSRRGDEEFEIRTEWSDRSVLYLHRSLADLGRLWQRLRDAFPEDRPELARGPLRQGLVAIKEAHDIETRLNEVEKLLKTIISMPCKYSRSEVVLTLFERSPLDQVFKNDNVHKIQPTFQSPVKISEIMRSSGFCLANTETIVNDHSIPNGRDQHLGVDPTEHLFENGSEFPSELEDGDDPAAYVTNLSYYHLLPFETDILD
ncbi:PX domain-containing protein 1 [Aotus nancymaae]|uniref:PX domain-containing protein 1 n=1 Tax=Aotus nancymaae TaxID=37293 RepID=UPI0030FE794E